MQTTRRLLTRLRFSPSKPSAQTSHSPSPSCHLVDRRCIVTSSTPPPVDVFIERPEMIVLAESSLYSIHNSWRDAFTSFFPAAGLHLASIDIMKTSPNSSSNEPISLASLEETLSMDLSHLGTMANVGDDFLIPEYSTPSTTSAHTVLIARGPIPSLVSQYFLESLPLAGLVLVDPLLLPEDGRVKKKSSNGRLSSSLDDMVSKLEGRRPMMAQDATTLPHDHLFQTQQLNHIQRANWLFYKH